MKNTDTQAAPGATLDDYEAKVKAQLEEAKARLDQFGTKASEKGAQAKSAASASLNTAKQNIDRKLQDLKTTHASNVARAKADIDEDVAAIKSSIDEFGQGKSGAKK